jgi:hypothetical protein
VGQKTELFSITSKEKKKEKRTDERRMPENLPLQPFLIPLRLPVLTAPCRVVHQPERLQALAEPIQRPVDLNSELILHFEADGFVKGEHALRFPRADALHSFGASDSDMVGEAGLGRVAEGGVGEGEVAEVAVRRRKGPVEAVESTSDGKDLDEDLWGEGSHSRHGGRRTRGEVEEREGILFGATSTPPPHLNAV